MEVINVLLGYFAKVLGISEVEASDLIFDKTEGEPTEGQTVYDLKLKDQDPYKVTLKPDVLTSLLASDSGRVEKIKSGVDTTPAFQKGYDKAKSEVLTAKEKELREKYDIEDTKLKLDDLLVNIIAKNSDDDLLPDDKVKTHPLYLALEKSKLQDIETLEGTHAKALEDLQKTQEQDKVLGKVNSLVLGYFNELNPILSQDPVKAENARKDFVNKFSSYEYQAQEEGDPLIIKDGKRVEDAHGNPLSLKSLVTSAAESQYDFEVQKTKGAPGNGKDDDKDEKTVVVPGSREEYDEAIFNAKSADERVALADAWEAAHPNE